MCYNSCHETLRNRTTVGKAASAGNPTVKSGQESAGSSSCSEFFRKFGVSMVSGISEKGIGRAKASTDSRSSAQADCGTKKQAGQIAAEWSSRRWLSNGSLDPQACGKNNRPSIRHPVSSLPCLETSGKSGMELPETGTTRTATERRGNCPLETIPMAAYKKTRQNMAPIWYFLMKAAFCSSPRSDELGLPRGTRPVCITSINEIGYPQSAHSQCRRKGNESLYISGIRPEMSTDWISETFSCSSSNTSADQSSCYGTALPSTSTKRSDDSWCAIPDCGLRTSRPTLRNSIRQNTSGTKPMPRLPIAHRKI